MFASINRTKLVPLGMTGALALGIVASVGFSEDVVAKQAPNKTAAAAQSALSKGQVDKAIELAEAMVAASPREPAYRALLAHAYLKAGRFQSASATFDDAMKLGDNSAMTALGLALSYSAAGRNRDAVAILDDWRDAIPVSDLGLALALAGEPTRGSAVLADALRNGENTPKLRQNLAYAYALDGRWREARIMMMQDVPAGEIDARISDWAAKTRPEDYQIRVAGLLNAPLRSDPGQPSRLALNTSPVTEQLAAQTAAVAPVQQVAAAATGSGAGAKQVCRRLCRTGRCPGSDPGGRWFGHGLHLAAGGPGRAGRPVSRPTWPGRRFGPDCAAPHCLCRAGAEQCTGYPHGAAWQLLHGAGRTPRLGHLHCQEPRTARLPHDHHPGPGAREDLLPRGRRRYQRQPGRLGLVWHRQVARHGLLCLCRPHRCPRHQGSSRDADGPRQGSLRPTLRRHRKASSHCGGEGPFRYWSITAPPFSSTSARP